MEHIRRYGSTGPEVIVLHGGPGAPGYMAPVARALSDAWQVFEPWQRRSGGEPLTVATHVTDVYELIVAECGASRPALVGSSWGAMLALACAAAHPDAVGPLVLIGMGTFDPAARAEMNHRLDLRKDAAVNDHIAHLCHTIGDVDARLAAIGTALLPAYTHDPVSTDLELGPCDERGRVETWNDMLRLQDNGTYPAAFAAITTPVLMLHGTVDPHPGAMIRDSIAPYVPHLEYHEWQQCGHYPWLERAVCKQFFEILRSWLVKQA